MSPDRRVMIEKSRRPPDHVSRGFTAFPREIPELRLWTLQTWDSKRSVWKLGEHESINRVGQDRLRFFVLLLIDD